MPLGVTGCHYMSLGVIARLWVSLYVIGCHCMPLGIIACHSVPLGVIACLGCQWVSLHAIRCYWVSLGGIACHWVSLDNIFVIQLCLPLPHTQMELNTKIWHDLAHLIELIMEWGTRVLPTPMWGGGGDVGISIIFTQPH